MESNKPSTSDQTSSQTENIQSRLSDLNRRLDLHVNLKDDSLREAYATAETEGELPTKRARVLILGEPRAGKTSLLNRLLGRGFDIREQPTQGIETRMCHVTNVDKQWNESGEAKADDIRECASAVAVLDEILTERPKSDVKRNAKKSPSASPVSEYAIVTDLAKMVLLYICVLVIFIQIGLPQYGYAVFVWASIAALAIVQDFDNAYRFATSMSLYCLLFEAVFRYNQPFEKLGCEAKDDNTSDGSFNQAFWFIKIILLNSLNAVMMGAAFGLGCRTGIAIAFSACVHPAPQSPETSGNMLVSSVIFVAGGAIGLGCYTYCTVNDRWHKRRTLACFHLMVLLLAALWRGDCSYRPHCYIFLNGFLTAVGSFWLAILGRRASHKFKVNYAAKKTAGFLFGLYLAHVWGWTLKIPSACLPSLAFYLLSVFAHPMFDLYTTYKLWRGKTNFSAVLIRDKMKAMIEGRPLLETKLSLWDFAGDTLYHCAHHVFMPDRALYVIVFNLEAAVSDEDGQLQKLLFWLHSVCAHARHPDAVVMIVGTHKASVPQASILRFTDELHRRITYPFCHRLVLNPNNDKPLFLVENSQLPDEDFQELRAEIFRRVESAEYAREKYPIKYLHFYREIKNRRNLAEKDRAENLMKLEQIECLAGKICTIKGNDDFKNMLQFFSEAGEIIYRGDDEMLRQYVVLDPQFLVDVMKKLVLIPRASHRSHRYAVEWRNYEDTGIITESLLQHIYSDMSQLIPLLTRLLQAYDMMCPAAPTENSNSSQKSFLVPAMLPLYRGDPVKFWESVGNEEVFYFDFGLFDPSTIYHRLLSRCLTRFHLDGGKPNFLPLVFADRCRFYVGTSIVFKLQLERSSQQMLLSVNILPFEPENSIRKLLHDLVDFVRSITARDYPHLCFVFGPRCPSCAHSVEETTSDGELTDDNHADRNLEQAIHVLKMAGHDQPFPTRSPVQMLCGQKKHTMRLSVSKRQGPRRSESYPPQRVAFGMETSITKLPPDLFQRVCSILNSSRGTRNWKTLAGELGRDVDTVTELDCERVANPTERLLLEWAMTDGGVTVADLLEVLGRPSLERSDIIEEVRAQLKRD